MMAITDVQSAKNFRLVLVEEGIPKSTIVIAKDPAYPAVFAARELQYHIEKITGATIPIVTDEFKVKGVKILVGESSITRQMGLSNDSFKSQEYLICFRPEMLILIGKDNFKPTEPSKNLSNIPPPDMYEEQGTCYAVYDFLEKFCDVRWYGPTELEMVYPQKNTLRISGRDIRRSPAFRYRSRQMARVAWLNPMIYILYNRPSEEDLALFRCRMRIGGQLFSVNHSFEGYPDRFWKPNPKNLSVFEGEHHEYFAQGLDGKVPEQMCFSNQALVQQVVQDARDYFEKGIKKYGTSVAIYGDFFSVAPRDTHTYCQCKACLSKIDEHIPSTKGVYPGGRVSNLVWEFVNKVAREVGKLYPNKYISALAYQDYAYYPNSIEKLEPNIAVTLCLVTNYWCIPWVEQNDMSVYQEWIKKEKGRRPIYIWAYNCFPDESARLGGWHCFPGFYPHTIARQVKMFYKDGITGIFLNGQGQQLDFYVYCKMMDDPTQNIDDILNEFFSRYYGHAAEPMKKIYNMIEEIYMNPSNYPEEIHVTAQKERFFDQNEEIAWKYLGTEERLQKLDNLMEEAKLLAKDDIEKKRVALFEEGVLNYMKKGREMYLQKESQKSRIEKMKKEPPPTVYVPRLPDNSAESDPRKVDWSKISAIEGTWYTVLGYDVETRISAKMTYDSNYLYIRFIEYIDTAFLVNNNEKIYTGDDWEIYFAPQRGRPFRQILINPKGHFEAWEHYIGGVSLYEPNVKVLSVVEPNSWEVFLVFPLQKFLPGISTPKEFYANFYRRHTKYGKLAWRPTFLDGAWFHTDERMGKFILE